MTGWLKKATRLLGVFLEGNAALEGDDSPTARFTDRVRLGNWTQIFTAAVRVSGSHLAARKLSVSDELDFQKQERLRELLRDLESTVVNGISPETTPQGSASVRRTMKGIVPFIATNVFAPGVDGFPADTDLTEAQLNLALRLVWEQASSRIDTIVVNGYQKRRINSFITSGRAYSSADTTYRELVSVYESDFGVCRVILSRAIPADTVLLRFSRPFAAIRRTPRPPESMRGAAAAARLRELRHTGLYPIARIKRPGGDIYRLQD